MIDAPLFIGPDQRALLAHLAARAEAEPINIFTARAFTRAEAGEHLAKMKDFTIILPGVWDFVVTHTIENGHPCGTARHMSMSINRPGRVPHPDAVWIVAQALGFWGDLSACATWLEDIGDGDVAVNVVQPLAN